MRTGSAIAGVDEVGRGPLAGPVVAAAVVLPYGHRLRLADSKLLAPKRREQLDRLIRKRALALAVALATHREIEALGIHHATLLAMARALEALQPAPPGALVDGRFVPESAIPCTPVIRGDASVPAISAASIVAKVTRDAMMFELDHRFPAYGFARNKGYATAAHLAALASCGPCPEHRRSFAPVRALL
ncbi:MAG TPA: ribonuclease HII [Gammaproteobacteria bacterium]|nr:ribonuclease HII [Gammaproteobacteria bacterium]